MHYRVRFHQADDEHTVQIQRVSAIELDIERALMDLDGPFYDCVESESAPLDHTEFDGSSYRADMFEDVLSRIAHEEVL